MENTIAEWRYKNFVPMSDAEIERINEELRGSTVGTDYDLSEKEKYGNHIRLFKKGQNVGCILIMYQFGQVIPEETMAIVDQNRISLDNFYQEIKTAPGIKPQDRNFLEKILDELIPIGNDLTGQRFLIHKCSKK